MSTFSFLLFAGGLVLGTNAIRGTGPSSTALWGKDESGKTIKTRERVSWVFLGALLVLLGAFQIMSHYSRLETALEWRTTSIVEILSTAPVQRSGRSVLHSNVTRIIRRNRVC